MSTRRQKACYMLVLNILCLALGVVSLLTPGFERTGTKPLFSFDYCLGEHDDRFCDHDMAQIAFKISNPSWRPTWGMQCPDIDGHIDGRIQCGQCSYLRSGSAASVFAIGSMALLLLYPLARLCCPEKQCCGCCCGCCVKCCICCIRFLYIVSAGLCVLAGVYSRISLDDENCAERNKDMDCGSFQMGECMANFDASVCKKAEELEMDYCYWEQFGAGLPLFFIIAVVQLACACCCVSGTDDGEKQAMFTDADGNTVMVVTTADGKETETLVLQVTQDTLNGATITTVKTDKDGKPCAESGGRPCGEFKIIATKEVDEEGGTQKLIKTKETTTRDGRKKTEQLREDADDGIPACGKQSDETEKKGVRGKFADEHPKTRSWKISTYFGNSCYVFLVTTRWPCSKKCLCGSKTTTTTATATTATKEEKKAEGSKEEKKAEGSKEEKKSEGSDGGEEDKEKPEVTDNQPEAKDNTQDIEKKKDKKDITETKNQVQEEIRDDKFQNPVPWKTWCLFASAVLTIMLQAMLYRMFMRSAWDPIGGFQIDLSGGYGPTCQENIEIPQGYDAKNIPLPETTDRGFDRVYSDDFGTWRIHENHEEGKSPWKWERDNSKIYVNKQPPVCAVRPDFDIAENVTPLGMLLLLLMVMMDVIPDFLHGIRLIYIGQRKKILQQRIIKGKVHYGSESIDDTDSLRRKGIILAGILKICVAIFGATVSTTYCMAKKRTDLEYVLNGALILFVNGLDEKCFTVLNAIAEETVTESIHRLDLVYTAKVYTDEEGIKMEVEDGKKEVDTRVKNMIFGADRPDLYDPAHSQFNKKRYDGEITIKRALWFEDFERQLKELREEIGPGKPGGKPSGGYFTPGQDQWSKRGVGMKSPAAGPSSPPVGRTTVSAPGAVGRSVGRAGPGDGGGGGPGDGDDSGDDDNPSGTPYLSMNEDSSPAIVSPLMPQATPGGMPTPAGRGAATPKKSWGDRMGGLSRFGGSASKLAPQQGGRGNERSTSTPGGPSAAPLSSPSSPGGSMRKPFLGSGIAGAKLGGAKPWGKKA